MKNIVDIRVLRGRDGGLEARSPDGPVSVEAVTGCSDCSQLQDGDFMRCSAGGKPDYDNLDEAPEECPLRDGPLVLVLDVASREP